MLLYVLLFVCCSFDPFKAMFLLLFFLFTMSLNIPLVSFDSTSLSLCNLSVCCFQIYIKKQVVDNIYVIRCMVDNCLIGNQSAGSRDRLKFAKRWERDFYVCVCLWLIYTCVILCLWWIIIVVAINQPVLGSVLNLQRGESVFVMRVGFVPSVLKSSLRL